MTKKSTTTLLCLAALLLAGLAWWSRDVLIARLGKSPTAAVPPTVKTGIVTTVADSHRLLPSLASTGEVRLPPTAPALAEALSYTSKLTFRIRLNVVHKLSVADLSTADVVFLRSFIADSRLPDGLSIGQVRALKNDVLNVLCLVPGGEFATAATLRALYADEHQDAGLRDYALQHLVTLIERDPQVGWSTHWAALEGANTDLAATALLHLAGQFRAQPSAQLPASPPSDLPAIHDPLLATLSAAALRLANDTQAKETVRTTALQVCGQLKLREARSLAAVIARSDKAGFPLRIAAVATLGDLGGDAETQAYLQRLATGSERRLRVPAESALKRFSLN